MAKTTKPTGLTEGSVREIVDGMLRSGFRDQSRAMEQHLRDIDRRLQALENKRVLGK